MENGGCWDVYPAIDLRRGRVVRLRQGDPDRETEYANDPLSVARRWREAGATWLHVVNLDGALNEGGRENQTALERILTAGLRVQFGGGLRDFAALDRALELGVRRVVVGTAAVKNPALVDQALRAFGPEHIALGIDAREGQVRTDGWQEAAAMTPLELASRWAARGVRWVIFTDVSRDGMGSGLNLERTTRVAQVAVPYHLNVIASGGVAGLEDVRQAYQAGLSGVIIGRALYEGQVALEEALRVGGCMEKETGFSGKNPVSGWQNHTMEVIEMSQVECAVSCFQEGFSCAQAMLSACGPQYGLDRELALKVAGAFGGGMGHMGHVCGAVTGAFMVIGLKYGKTRPEDNESRDTAYRLVQEFAERFKSRNGSIVCRELLGYDISTPEALEIAREEGLFETLCPRLVQDAAEIIGEILE